MNDTYKETMIKAVYGAVRDAVNGAVYWAVYKVVRDAVNGAVYWAVYKVVYDAVNEAVGPAVVGPVRAETLDLLRSMGRASCTMP